MKNRTTSVYLVGYDEEHAWTGLVYDSYEMALDYVYDNPGMRVFQVGAILRRETMEEITAEVIGEGR